MMMSILMLLIVSGFACIIMMQENPFLVSDRFKGSFTWREEDPRRQSLHAEISVHVNGREGIKD